MFRMLRDDRDTYLGELRGATVYGRDEEKLGKVEDAIVDDTSAHLHYLVIDSGLLSSRRFILPADQVFASADDNDLYANLTKADVESLPEFRDDVLDREESFLSYQNAYRTAWRYDIGDRDRARPSRRLERAREGLRDRFTRDRAARAERRLVEDRELRTMPPASYTPSTAARPATVYGVFSDRDDVEKTVAKLQKLNFVSSDISVVFPDKQHTREFAIERNTKSPEGALAGGSTGFVVGGVLGWLAGIGTLAIPGIGPLIAAGPIVAAIAGAGVGSAIGGIAGALIGLGVPELEAKRYEEEIRRGRILMSVHCDNLANAKRAREVLEEFGAKEVFLSGELRAA